MKTKLQEFIDYFKNTEGTGLLVLKNDSFEDEVSQLLNQSEFKVISSLSEIKQAGGSYVFYFNKDSLKYIYNIYKQISDGLSMIQSKNPDDMSDEIAHINTENFRLLLVITDEDIRYAQNLLDFDFINLAGMIEYINK